MKMLYWSTNRASVASDSGSRREPGWMASLWNPWQSTSAECRPPWVADDGGVHISADLPTATRRSDAPEVRREAAAQAIDAMPPTDVTIWSDGSAKGGTTYGGAGALIQLHVLGREEHVRAPAGTICSSLRAELLAMREALAAVTRLPEEDLTQIHRVRLLTDSKCGLQLLQRGAGAQTMRLAAEVWSLLHALQDRDIKTYLQWVPGHAGLEGNEAADRLANEAAVEDQAPIPIDLASAKGAIKRHIVDLTRARAAAAHPHPELTPGHDLLTRWEAVTLSQLRTGFSPLTRDVLFRLNLAADGNCPACQEPDSAAHLLVNCPVYAAARCQRWGIVPTLGDVWSDSAAAVIGFLRAVGWVDPPTQ